MAQFQNMFKVELNNGAPPVVSLKQIHYGDIKANRIGVIAQMDGRPFALSGTCSGSAILADGSTVPITGSVSGNTAYIDLPNACYSVEGIIKVFVKLTHAGVTATLLAAVGTVALTETGTVIDPGTVIPSISALLSEIETAVASIPADYSELIASLAPTFDSGETYAAGAFVWYNGSLYRFTADHAAGAWSGGDSEVTPVSDALTALHAELAEFEAETATALAGKASSVSKSATGMSVTITDGTGGMAFLGVNVRFDAVQEGGDDPSPSNVRLFTSIAGCEVSFSGEDTSDPDTRTYDFEHSESGLIYGGSLNVLTGVLTVDSVLYQFDGSEEWGLNGTVDGKAYYYVALSPAGLVPRECICSHGVWYPISAANTGEGANIGIVGGNMSFSIRLPADTVPRQDVDAFKAWLAAQAQAGTPLQAMGKLETPATYQFDSVDWVMYNGVNNLSCTAGELTAVYPVDIEDAINLTRTEILQTVDGALASVQEFSVMMPYETVRGVMKTDGTIVTIGSLQVRKFREFAGKVVYLDGSGTFDLRKGFCYVWFMKYGEMVRYIQVTKKPQVFEYLAIPLDDTFDELWVGGSNMQLYIRGAVDAYARGQISELESAIAGTVSIGAQWAGKIWYCYGTSLSNIANEGKYPTYLAQMSGLNLVCKGISGGGIGNLGAYSRGQVYNAICNTTDGKLNADLITLETGANDVGEVVPLGTVYDTGQETLAGCLNDCIRYLQKNTNAQIVIIASPFSKTMPTLATKAFEWRELMRQICFLNEVEFIAADTNMGSAKGSSSKGSMYFVDNIHHTNLGGFIVAQHIWFRLRNIPAFYTTMPGA